MGLTINEQSKGDDDMAGQGKTATARVYRTVDGELVGEGDPRGAFLAYPVGAAVPAGEVDAYDRLMAKADDAGLAQRANAGDDDARAQLRELQAGTARRAVNDPPVLMSDRLATELADEQRSLANQGAEAVADAAAETSDDRTVTTYPVYRTETGDLVHEGHPDAATLAYAPGTTVADADVAEFNDLGAPKNDDTTETKMAPQPANKARSRSAGK